MRRLVSLFCLFCLAWSSALAGERPAGAAAREWETAPLFTASRPEGSTVSALQPVAAAEAGEFRIAEDGTRYLTLRFQSPGAEAIRLHLTDLRLPPGARVFVYGVESGSVTDVAGPYRGASGSIDADLWTAAVRGSEAVLELQQGEADIADLPFTVSEMEAVPAAEAGAEPQVSAREMRTSLFRGMPVAHEVVGGLAMFEGDIVLGEPWELPPAAASKSVSRSAVAITGSQYRWPGGVVPYSVDPTMPNLARITDAVAHWNTLLNGVVKLIPRTTESAYVYFYRSTSAGQCASSVGRLGYRQYLYLGDSCGTGNMIHEIGHAAGLWHEQSREDRDRFIKVNLANIATTASYNFNQSISNGDDVNGYDYGSIMHYSAYAFSANGLPTIETIPAGIPIGQRSGLSPGDVAAIKFLYPTTILVPPPAPPAPTPVAISLSTNPAGMPVTADGTTYTAATTLNWLPGSSHFVSAGTPPVTAGTRYSFQSWSDNGAQVHLVTAPSTAMTLKATYSVAYQLKAAPAGPGTVTVTPASADTFYAPGAGVLLSATPQAGACFTGWTGLIAGTAPNTALAVVKPYDLKANFQTATIAANPSVLSPSGGGGSYYVGISAPAACMWSFKSPVGWIRLRSVPPASGSAGLSMAVDPNNTGVLRSATVTFGSATLTVTQRPK